MAGNISVVGAGPVSPGVTTLTGVDFYGASSMGSASINVTGAGLSVFGDAELTLNNTSTAANATLTIGGQVSLGFDEASTAAQATIINNNGGFTGFQNQASAGTSHIINNTGGLTMFLGSATADTATIVNNAGGAVDVSRMTTGVGIGSLSGAGNIYLGGTRLSLGNLAQNDEISGIIADGASPEYVAFVAQRGAIAPSPTGGSLVKVGGGTLTLTAQNTYTGEHRSMAASCGSARTQILAHPRAHSVSAAGR